MYSVVLFLKDNEVPKIHKDTLIRISNLYTVSLVSRCQTLYAQALIDCRRDMASLSYL